MLVPIYTNSMFKPQDAMKSAYINRTQKFLGNGSEASLSERAMKGAQKIYGPQAGTSKSTMTAEVTKVVVQEILYLMVDILIKCGIN